MKKMAFRVVIASLLLVSVFAGTASASSVSVGSGLAGSATAVETSDDKTATAKASATFTGAVNGGGITFVWECDGQGIGLAAATSMRECYLETNGAKYSAISEINLPGNAVASAQSQTLRFDEIGPTVRVCAVVDVLPILGGKVEAVACVDQGVGLDLGDISSSR